MPDEYEEVTLTGEDEHGASVEVGLPVMSLRDYYAGEIAKEVLPNARNLIDDSANGFYQSDAERAAKIVAKLAFIFADALIEEGKKK